MRSVHLGDHLSKSRSLNLMYQVQMERYAVENWRMEGELQARSHLSER